MYEYLLDKGNYVKKRELSLKFKVLRSYRLRSSILQDKLSEIGKIKTFKKEVNLSADKKRFWLGKIRALNDCLFTTHHLLHQVL